MSEIRIERVKNLSGPNIWAYCPVLEIHIDIGKYEQLPSNKLPGFTERLVEAVPSLWEHRCSEDQPGGFLERLHLGTYMGHIIEHIILELQSLAGMETGFGRTRGAGREGLYQVVAEYKDAQATRMCAHLAVEIAEKLAEGKPLDLDLKARIEQIRELAEENMLGPSTRAIVSAAKRRGIPWFRLDGDGGALVQLGHGKYARRIQATESSSTSSIAVDIASNKELTKALLGKVGVPVPQGSVATTPDEAWAAATAIGGHLVVKPADGNQGKAVSVNLTTEEQIRKAFHIAQQESPSKRVIVEQYITGQDYRLLVVGGKLVAAALRRPAQVVADGLHTVRDLVRMVNEDPRRGHGHGSVLTRIRIDSAAELTLEKQGYNWESVPPAGQVVFLRDNSNLSTGGTATDVTHQVHPENAKLAVLAAQMLGLDIAGIDVLCEDIAYSIKRQGGAVVEVNAAPGLRMHLYPSEGKSRPVGDAIVEMLFPRHNNSENANNGRIPLIAITGTNGKTTVTRMVAHVYHTMKRFVGMATTDGIYFDSQLHVKGDCAGPRSAEAVLQHPMVEVAVLETARGGILRSGLAWDRSTVSVVLNVANDHLGLDGIETPERLARVKRVPLESVASDGYGVLNAEDPLVADMAEYCPGQVIFFGMDRSGPVMSAHLAEGGKGVYVDGGLIILAEMTREQVLLPVDDIPATYGGLIPFQVHNAIATAAACWGAGVPLESIRLGLRTFQADEKGAPGRFNLFNLGHARVIVDYGHNPHAHRAVQSAIFALQPRRAIGVVTAPGDRRDQDIRDLASVAAYTYDWLIVHEDADLRGREPGQVARLITDTIAELCPSLPVSVAEDEEEAVEQALEMARDGDLVVIFADQVDQTLDQVWHASRAVSEVHGGFFHVPLIGSAPLSKRDRIEAVAELAAQGIYLPHEEVYRDDEPNT